MREYDGDEPVDTVVCDGAWQLGLEKIDILLMGAWLGCDADEPPEARCIRGPGASRRHCCAADEEPVG